MRPHQWNGSLMYNTRIYLASGAQTLYIEPSHSTTFFCSQRSLSVLYACTQLAECIQLADSKHWHGKLAAGTKINRISFIPFSQEARSKHPDGLPLGSWKSRLKMNGVHELKVCVQLAWSTKCRSCSFYTPHIALNVFTIVKCVSRQGNTLQSLKTYSVKKPYASSRFIMDAVFWGVCVCETVIFFLFQ